MDVILRFLRKNLAAIIVIALAMVFAAILGVLVQVLTDNPFLPPILGVAIGLGAGALATMMDSH
jgi:VIT1/CCC1 family predicted Fe2+/Mn2+ transporter